MGPGIQKKFNEIGVASMEKVLCPQSKNCGMKMVRDKDEKGKVIKETLGCPHMTEHEHVDGCDNGVCSLVTPKSSKCLPVAMPVVEAPVAEAPVLPDTEEALDPIP